VCLKLASDRRLLFDNLEFCAYNSFEQICALACVNVLYLYELEVRLAASEIVDCILSLSYSAALSCAAELLFV